MHARTHIYTHTDTHTPSSFPIFLMTRLQERRKLMMRDDTSQNKEGSCECLSVPASDSALPFQVTRKPVCVCACVCTCMHRHIPVHICACMHTIMCTCFCMLMCVWAPYVFMSMFLCVSVCVHTCFVPVCMCIVGNMVFFKLLRLLSWFIILLLWVINAQSSLLSVLLIVISLNLEIWL